MIPYDGSTRIPKIIHQIWFQGKDKIPEKYHKNIESIKNHYKTWTYILWTDESIRQLLNEEELKLYNEYKYMHQKIDFSKYVILYKYGGMYIDIDALSIKPIDPLLEQYKDKDLIISATNTDYVAAIILCSKPKCINNGIIISTPNHYILKKIIEYCLQNKDTGYNYFTSIVSTTGPDMFTKIIDKYKTDKTLILPHDYLEPCNNTICKVTDNTYIKHDHAMTWVDPFVKKMNYIYINYRFVYYILVLLIIYLLYKYRKKIPILNNF